jgi:hypothetical protein
MRRLMTDLEYLDLLGITEEPTTKIIIVIGA